MSVMTQHCFQPRSGFVFDRAIFHPANPPTNFLFIPEVKKGKEQEPREEVCIYLQRKNHVHISLHPCSNEAAGILSHGFAHRCIFPAISRMKFYTSVAQDVEIVPPQGLAKLIL